MLHRALAVILSPLLLAQGLYVRHVTPRLPEAAGARAGVCGAGPALKLLIVGDSAAAGVGAAKQDDALAGQLSALLAAHYRLDWQLWAENGRRACDVLDLLERNAAEPFDIALISIGVNDVTGLTGESRWLAQQTDIWRMLQEKYHAKRIFVTGLPPMHRFTALPQPLRWVLGQRARQFNRALARTAAGHPGCVLIDVDFPIRSEYLASDGFHPGPPAYAHWAAQTADAIRTPGLRG